MSTDRLVFLSFLGMAVLLVGGNVLAANVFHVEKPAAVAPPATLSEQPASAPTANTAVETAAPSAPTAATPAKSSATISSTTKPATTSIHRPSIRSYGDDEGGEEGE